MTLTQSRELGVKILIKAQETDALHHQGRPEGRAAFAAASPEVRPLPITFGWHGFPRSAPVPISIHQMSQEEPAVLAPRREGCWKTRELWPSLGKERHTSKVE